uniref:Stage 0 sporulation protein A homolog n=1 Tax=Eubacterium plexicaudatum ASF492 TaxID=1235802 RepID=N2BIP2_9FIRM
MYKVAICDDDDNYRMLIRNIIAEDKNMKNDTIFYEYTSGEDLLDDVNQMHDLLFLDIAMPGINGNKTAKEFRQINKDAILVFCTNYQQPTTESFKVQPFRYIIKDLYNQVLKDEMPDIIREIVQQTNIQYINITDDGNVHRIPLKDILYISVAKRGAIIHQYCETGEKEISCRETVKELYEKLSGEGFVYAHNSYIVNMANIIHVRKNVLTLKDNIELNISRSKQKDFDSCFSDFLCLRYKRK